MRRTFRVGVRLGLLFGIGFAVFKLLQSRRPGEVPLPAAPPDPWPPVPAPAPKPAAAPAPAPAPKPAAPPAPKPAVQDLIEGPPPSVAPRPVKKAAKTTKATGKAVKKATKATKAAKKTTATAWVQAQGGVCPLSHPIKAKVASMIFHLPGMLNYTRTRPDRCYASEAAAKRDGFAPAKR